MSTSISVTEAYDDWNVQHVDLQDHVRLQNVNWGRWSRCETLRHLMDVVPFFDFDAVLVEPPQEYDLYESRCEQAIKHIFGPDPTFSISDNVLKGWRHGYKPDGTFKVSLRYWIRGYSIQLQDMPALIRDCGGPDNPWDLSIYSSRRNMSVPGACKDARDRRVLEVQHRDRLELYVIQNLDGAERRLQGFDAAVTPTRTLTCLPPNWDAVKSLLEDFGFNNPYPVGSRQMSVTFRSDDIGAPCPCCPGQHDRQSYFVMERPDGRLMVSSYSLTCRRHMLGEAKSLFGDDGIEDMSLAVTPSSQLSNSLDAAMYKVLGSHVDPNSVVATNYGFDFRTVDNLDPCRVCSKVHPDQTYRCSTLVIPCCEVSSTDARCRPTVVAWEEAPVLASLVSNPYEDTAFVQMLQMQQMYHGFKWVHDGDGWYRFDGVVWKPSKRQDFTQTLQHVATPALKTLVKFLGARETAIQLKELDPNANVKTYHKNLIQAHNYLQKHSGLDSIIKTAEDTIMYDGTFADKLDKDLDVVGAPNGVVCLKTGQLLKGAPDQYVSKQVGVAFGGLDLPTPDVDAFFDSIFNGDRDVITWLQRYLGYGLTAHTKEAKFVIFWGAGSNGKSLLSDMLQGVFGDYYKSMARECLFNNDRRSGGASPHLAELQGVRLGVVDESRETDALDTAIIKQVTGSSTINCRPLYKNNVVFKLTHKPLLLTNHRPAFNTDDGGMLRRLALVPFENVYKAQEDFDATNRHHRLRDSDLGDRLLSEPVLAQFLTWLVKGAVEWYDSGLGQTPELLDQARQAYVGENDLLSGFIASSCKVGSAEMVDTTEFREAFQAGTEMRMTPATMKAKMAKRGFLLQRKRASGQGQKQMFQGLCLL